MPRQICKFCTPLFFIFLCSCREYGDRVFKQSVVIYNLKLENHDSVIYEIKDTESLSLFANSLSKATKNLPPLQSLGFTYKMHLKTSAGDFRYYANHPPKSNYLELTPVAETLFDEDENNHYVELDTKSTPAFARMFEIMDK